MHRSNCRQRTGLIVAAHPESVRFLLDFGVEVNGRDRHDWTPLHFAARTKSTQVIGMLLDAGAEVNTPNDEGVTPLHLSFVTPPTNLRVVELMLEHGGDPSKTYGKCCALSYVQTIAFPEKEEVRALFERFGF